MGIGFQFGVMKVLRPDRGDGRTAMCLKLMLLSCALQNGHSGQFHVMHKPNYLNRGAWWARSVSNPRWSHRPTLCPALREGLPPVLPGCVSTSPGVARGLRETRGTL